jgi:hypothetical protein
MTKSVSGEVLAPRPTPQEKSRRDRVGLRAMAQDSVHHFTMLRRDEISAQFFAENGYRIDPADLDRLQPLVEEFDPVVELSIIAIDRRNDVSIRRQALSDAAQYLRPKLSAVAMLDDPETLAAQSQKHELALKLVGLMGAVASAKKTVGEGS